MRSTRCGQLAFFFFTCVFLGGCQTCQTYTQGIRTPNEQPFPEFEEQIARDKDAVIEISAPQIYSRESLINDRRDEEEYLKDLLTQSRTVAFEPELFRDLSKIAALALDLGLAFDPNVALQQGATEEHFELEAQRERAALEQDLATVKLAGEARQVQHEIDLLKLQIELESLKKQLAALQAGSPQAVKAATADNADAAGAGDGTGDAATPAAESAFPEADVPPSRLAELQGSINTLLDKVTKRVEPARKAGVTMSPREEFRARQAYRRDLRSALAEARLDDVHDQHGRSLYRLQFQATVAPGRYKGKWGVAELTLEQPEVEARSFFLGLYRTWLGHVTYRLNQAEAHRTDAAGHRITDPIYRSLAASSDLYKVQEIYFDPAENRATKLDRCDLVTDPVQATGAGCSSLQIAMPPRSAESFRSPAGDVRVDLLRMLTAALRSESTHPGYQLPNELALETTLTSDHYWEYKQLSSWQVSQYRAWWEAGRPEPDPDADERHRELYRECLRIHEMLGNGICSERFFSAGTTPFPPRHLVHLGEMLSSRRPEADVLTVFSSRGIALDRTLRPEERVPASAEYRFWEEYVTTGKLKGRALDDAARAAIRQAESRLLDSFLDLGKDLSVADWSQFFEPQDALGYATEILKTAPSMAASLQGLAGRRDLDRVEAEKIISLLESLTAAVKVAEDFHALLWDLNKCGEFRPVPTVPDPEQLVQVWLLSTADTREWGQEVSPSFFGPLGTGCEQAFNSRDRCELGGNALVHATAPQQLSQHVSTVASATRALQMAASISASFPGSGAGADAGLGVAKGATGQVQALEQVPLVVGFSSPKPAMDSEISVDNADEDAAAAGEDGVAFGWVFGPPATVNPEDDSIELHQTLNSYDVTADLLVPGWWPRVDMTLRSGWIGNWHDPDLLNPEGLRQRTIVKELPLNRADLDNLTSVIAIGALGRQIHNTEVYRTYPDKISLCNDDTSLLIYGANVWRSTEVHLGGVPAEPGSVRVLPDMEGVSAGFDLTKLKNKSSKQANPNLVVWTRSGYDSREIELTGSLDKNGKCTDKKTAAIPKQRITTVSPATVSRCSDSVTFAIETVDFLVGEALLGSVTATDISGALTPDTKSDKRLAYLVRFTGLNGENKGLTAWPLTLVSKDGKVLSKDISVIGKGKDCTESTTPPVPVLKVAQQPLNLCAPIESITLIGQGADQVTKVNFLGRDSVKLEDASKTSVTARFVDLPHYDKPDEMPNKERLEFFIGTKRFPLEAVAKCKK